jgi:integrase/recombinase XerD
MRKRTSPTILEQAVAVVPEFENVIDKLSNQVTLRGQSKSTLDNYTRRIALLVLHFNRLPEQVSEDEINEYLVALARDPKSPSKKKLTFTHYDILMLLICLKRALTL